MSREEEEIEVRRCGDSAEIRGTKKRREMIRQGHTYRKTSRDENRKGMREKRSYKREEGLRRTRTEQAREEKRRKEKRREEKKRRGDEKKSGK